MTGSAHRPRTGLAWVLAAACALAACTPGGGTATPGPVTPRTVTIISDEAPVDGWDPATATRTGALDDIYETLTRYDSASHQIVPLLATAWQPSRDGTVWRFSLRDAVRFHSGRPMTSEAVRAAILDTARRDPASPWHFVRSVATPDDGTLTITLNRPLPLADLAAAGHGAFVYDVRAAGDAPGKDGGTGPYRVARSRPGTATPLTLARVPGYWGGWKDGQFTGVTFAVEKDPDAAVKRLRAHESAIALRLPYGQWADLRGEEGVQTSSASSWRELFALLDTHRLADPRVRRALSYAAGGGTLTGDLLPATGVVPDGLYGHFTDLPVYPHDPDRARALLASAGKKHLNLTLSYADGPGLAAAAHALAGRLRDIGVTADVRKRTPTAGGQDIALVYRRPDAPDPYDLFAGTFATGAPGNLGRYSSPALDRLLAGVRATAAENKDTAAQTYRRAQTRLLTDAPALFLGATQDRRAFRTDFLGYVDDPGYPDVVFAYELAARAP